MPGFELALGKYDFSIKDRVSKLICQTVELGPRDKAYRLTLNKFLNDKLFEGNDEVFIIIEGVITNKASLLGSSESWFDTVYQLYKSYGDTFYSRFRGSFCGALYDKKKEQWIIFADHIGSKFLYYSHLSNELYVSNEISSLYSLFENSSTSYSLDSNAAYMLLSYGYMLGDNTLCSQIRKVLPGHYLKFRNGKLTKHQYYQLPLSKVDGKFNEEKAIEELDRRFRQAVKLQFEKDKEYNYKHFVGLSGGLDSRMTSWVAHEMGYKDQLNFTFSQSDYLDETIPKKIASELRHEWIFKALDNGLFLKDLEEINYITGGNVLYYGLAHGNSLFKHLNFERYGIIHSGQLGDIVIGSFIKDLDESPSQVGGVYSEKLLDRIDHVAPRPETLAYKERVLIYQRGFNGANNGLLGSQNYSETMSPFYDIEFFEYCLSIPIKHRVGHKLYKKWIINKYPAVVNHIWEATKAKITSNPIKIKLKGKNIPVQRVLPLLLYKLGLGKPSSQTKHHMNPLDYWYECNPEIRKYQDEYFEESIGLLEVWPVLHKDVRILYNSGSAVNKNQALTLLSAIKLFYKKAS